MGRKNIQREIVIIICLVLTGAFIVVGQPEAVSRKKELNLETVLKDVNNWKWEGSLAVKDEVLLELAVDDYVNCWFSNKEKIVSLYIGYYLSGGKIGAAHDPLVCFPGQGWLITELGKQTVSLDSSGGQSVSFSSMTVRKGIEDQYIAYWFQSYDRSYGDTFSQKVSASINKILRNREESAFVRVAVAVEGRPLQECRRDVLSFVQDFYPAFLKFVKS